MRIGYDLYVNVNLRVCAANQASAWKGEGKLRRQKQTSESTKGSLGSPSRYVSMLFFVFREACCYFWRPDPSHLF
ncbi:hypothetical protein KPSA3_04066 [Pseudomonas syringae pv. actinidiae]|uniref:Uncharacterized protein n=1 Tax=Pseudomonas syringae pv. actinidiae TaxID=103796 RepID=A0AAN4Q6B9_PSESF|nr:hypothetical protein KPSA3_04066 [Pseudomonas syringae pv. actinidiae]